MTFNPFEKALDDVIASGLQGLIDREVAEGLYVEYKQEFPKNDKIGQSLASFANSYGGWYIVGVEADKQRNTASKVTGIDLTVEKDPISKIR
jgi:predicted HTH transcriptional regulator